MPKTLKVSEGKQSTVRLIFVGEDARRHVVTNGLLGELVYGGTYDVPAALAEEFIATGWWRQAEATTT